MADLMQLSIQGIPVGSFLGMLAAFWALGMILTRRTAQPESTLALRTRVAPLPAPQETPAPSRPVAAERQLAA